MFCAINWDLTGTVDPEFTIVVAQDDITMLEVVQVTPIELAISLVDGECLTRAWIKKRVMIAGYHHLTRMR